MVSKKRLDFGFNGYQAPVIPKAPRSIRRRGPRKKLVEDNKFCAFELLAAVAGKLLEETESSASSNIAEGKFPVGICTDEREKMQLIDDKALKSESFDHGSCAESAFIPEVSAQEHNLLSNFKGLRQDENDCVAEHTSVHESYDLQENIDCDIKLGICEDKNSDGCKLGGSVSVGDSYDRKLESGSENEKNQIGYISMANVSTVKDPIGECVNTNVLINSESSVQLPVYRDSVHGALLQKHWNNVKLGIRDDDENSFGRKKTSAKIRPFRPQPRMGHRRIRKTMASKYWKAGPRLKDCELYNTSEGMNTFYRYRNSFYARERCQRAHLKKRKFSKHRYDHEHSNNSISNLPEKGMRGDKSSSAVILHRASRAPAAGKGHQKVKDPHVKFSIKSFKVPELYIEVPETATVGSLKRTVMEAVTAILGSGIRVGVVFQGKKVRDDHRTLQQAGISQSSNVDNLGFTLEPSFTHISPSATPKKLPVLLPCDEDQPLPRSPTTPMIDSGISNASVEPPIVTNLDNVNNNELISPSKTTDDAIMDGAGPDSKALVPVSPMDAEALAVVQANPKPKRTEISQRRTRRPFSVAEVEALVEAVEKLGTELVFTLWGRVGMDN
ncbi:hypothetical protein CDL12_26159 [Handroanthus impetiginosus]|uniref:Ubiquitin-like domain-containing protein n=1 Tax=Handroanthus impetiginosus TaxID=429701 RepID=A0A2G9G7S3_9LAMI|nr:hypothetical protein CDL12_26159 [Handroanthus impetiginosus]